MNNIYQPSTLTEVHERLGKLKPDAQRLWGKMDVAQMLAHCSSVLEIALGDKQASSSLLAKVMGPMLKGMVTNEKPFKRELPTDKNFLIVDARVFDVEKKKLGSLIDRFYKGGEAAMEGKKHPFFGRLTAKEWGTATYKHLDHHFSQFGV
jgi:hypothetical protein